MSAYKNGENQNLQSMTAKNDQALQSALDDAEQALAGDPLQEAVKQKKSEQQFK
ncbi:small, acid-soluble spore protein, SspJ family [Virgibacillus indicus]|uniref:Small, acid-soluble spore protein, SspJ family n=1 Tax=Virgibacillus indicus TaxID=2024554 RepID=A0A265N6C3_9BACI|nr:small acid-soluble spore protein SspJ [Virgibacillus indicus]OZU87351.1 small, acid-soluble spore protein, SspJ family [Virgibacillus indicus]